MSAPNRSRRLVLRLTAIALAVLTIGAAWRLLTSRAKRGGKDNASKARVLVVGLDGLSWDVITPWLAEGRMPNLSRLIARGASAPLRTVLPADSPPGWTSAITGVNPGKHGLFGFLRPLAKDLKPEFVSSADRRYLALWSLLSQDGAKVGVINVPCTSPPDPVQGFMVGGFPFRKDEAVAFPADLLEKYPDYRLEVFGSTPAPGREEVWVEELYQVEAARRHLALEKLSEGGYDLFFVVLTGTDRIQHHLWKFMDRAHPLHDPARAAALGNAIRDFHTEMDRALGELVAAAGPEAITLVLSDHGFGPTYHGIALEQMFRRLNPDLPANAAPRAYLYNYYGGVYVSLRGREPFGMVSPGVEYDAERARISGVLRELRDPDDDRALVSRIYRKEEVYHGDSLRQAPDLLFVESEGYLVARFPSERLVGTLPHPHFSGHHRQDGILVLAGPGVRSDFKLTQASILDVAPTVLYLLDKPVPSYMDGRPLTSALDEARVASFPPRTVERDGHRAPSGGSGSGASAKEVEEQLRSLGYLQ